MNFLGHLLVSGNDPLVIAGNFMGDAIKGRIPDSYPEAMRAGIRMHRSIDTFTDNHPITLVGRERLRAHAGKYAGVALDVFYDHALIRSWDHARYGDMDAFVDRMYHVLQEQAYLMPERTRNMLQYMVQGDWLRSYASIAGIGKALAGLGSRVPEGHRLVGSERVLAEHLEAYTEEAARFLADLRKHLQQHG